MRVRPSTGPLKSRSNMVEILQLRLDMDMCSQECSFNRCILRHTRDMCFWSTLASPWCCSQSRLQVPLLKCLPRAARMKEAD